MNIAPRTRLIGYVTGYLLAGVWAALAPYLAHRGVDAYTLALASALVALASGGLHAIAAGHISLPGDPSSDDGSAAAAAQDAAALAQSVVSTPVPATAPTVTFPTPTVTPTEGL